MSTALEHLCQVFEDQLERQECMLAVCTAQGAAVRSRDVAELETRTGALQRLIQESVDAEQQRLSLIGSVVEELALPVEEQTLSGLIAAVADPWKSRMAEFQQRIREVLDRTRQVIRENHRMMQQSLRMVNNTMDMLVDSVPEQQNSYDAQGVERGRENFPVSMLDQRG